MESLKEKAAKLFGGTDNKPDLQPRDCALCKFMTELSLPPPEMGTEMICQHSPPNITQTPQTDKFGNIGVIKAVGFPRVKATNWCWQFEEKPDTQGN